MKKLLAIALSAALIPGAAFAKKPSTPDPSPKQVILVDANGGMVGDAFQSVEIRIATVYFQVGDALYTATYNDTDFTGYSFYYDGPDCTGNVYTIEKDSSMGMTYLSLGTDNILYKGAEVLEPVVTIYSYGNSFRGSFRCTNYDAPIDRYDWLGKPTPVIDLNSYTQPYRVKLVPGK